MLGAMYIEPPAARGIVRPTEAEVRAALSRCRPELARATLRYIGEGWASWAFETRGIVLRFPKLREAVDGFAVERRLLPALAPVLPVRVPEPVFYCEDGPNGLPFAGARYVPGVTPQELRRPASLRFAADAGRLLRVLHSFPPDEAAGLGLPVDDGAVVRRRESACYEDVVRRVFPLISCEARSYCEAEFEAYLNEPANFAFEPRLVHNDLDQRNTVLDPETGDLVGLVDFGDARIGDPAADFVWLLTIGLRDLGIDGQAGALLRAYDPARRIEELQSRIDFYYFGWPLGDILHGLDLGDEEFVAEGIRSLNARVLFGTRC